MIFMSIILLPCKQLNTNEKMCKSYSSNMDMVLKTATAFEKKIIKAIIVIMTNFEVVPNCS